jgi:hypothetical protein
MIYKPLLQVSQLAFAEIPNSRCSNRGISGAQFR